MSNSLQAGLVTDTKISRGITRTPHSRPRLIIEIVIWVLAVAGMVALSFFAHTHRQPVPFELAFSKDVQAVPFPAWVGSFFRFLTFASDPRQDEFEVPIVLILFVICRWFWQALFLGLAVGIGNGVDALIGDFVGRPRPKPNMIHVDSKLIFNSFPSGHSCHMMVFYGFLLYLTFTQPVRQSRYRWLLIPFQIWAILNILVVGFARVWEGEHWVTDVLGGYLDGAIWLMLFIFLYNLTLQKVHERREKRLPL